MPGIVDIPMNITRTPVEPRRHLRGDWTIEVANDLRALHGMNLEQELFNTMIAEMTPREAMMRFHGVDIDEILEGLQPPEELTFECEGDMYRYRLGM